MGARGVHQMRFPDSQGGGVLGLGRMYRTYGSHPSPLHGRCVRHEISNSIREQLVMAGGRQRPRPSVGDERGLICQI